jgi:hypothetical protein
VGENIHWLYIKGHITRIYRELKNLNSPKINEPIKKWATELNRTFSKEEIQMAKIHKKMLTIPGHKGNANQNHTDSTSPLLEQLSSKTPPTTTCWRGCGGKGMQASTTTLENNMEASSLNIDLPYDPAIPFIGIDPKEYNSGNYKGTCTPMFIAALFTITKLWNQPRCHTTNKWIKKMWYLYTMEFYSPQRRMKFCH